MDPFPEVTDLPYVRTYVCTQLRPIPIPAYTLMALLTKSNSILAK